MIVRVVALALCGLSVSGCATIIRGAKQDFNVVTEPPGATVSLSTGETCEATPCKFRRPRKEAFTVTVAKPGYKTQTADITHGWSRDGLTTGIVGNVILGGIIGMGIDAANGANQDLRPNPLVLTLEAEGAAPAAAPTTAGPSAGEGVSE